LELALGVLGVGKGDCVFLPDFTFFATAEAVCTVGAVPIFVDVEEDTFNMCTNSLEKAIKAMAKGTELVPKAIITVDLFGQPANYPKIEKIAREYNLKIIEDGAQGFGGSIGGKKACSFGDIATTSFFPAKPLGCYGDGGAVFTHSEEYAKAMRSLAVHGKSPMDKYDNLKIGMNSRLDTIQAAVLGVKLKAFEEKELEQVNVAAQYYTENLEGAVKTPTVPQGFYSSWAQYTIRLESREKRDELQGRLKENGIPTMVYYPKTMSEQTALEQYKKVQPICCATAQKLADTSLSLPMGPYITRQEQDEVIRQVKSGR
ncbi:MAG: DegT/DnrJ/EryC1/StrS family aminotransferase, partial [Oscillospiraceae bacterium]